MNALYVWRLLTFSWHKNIIGLNLFSNAERMYSVLLLVQGSGLFSVPKSWVKSLTLLMLQWNPLWEHVLLCAIPKYLDKTFRKVFLGNTFKISYLHFIATKTWTAKSSKSFFNTCWCLFETKDRKRLVLDMVTMSSRSSRRKFINYLRTPWTGVFNT